MEIPNDDDVIRVEVSRAQQAIDVINVESTTEFESSGVLSVSDELLLPKRVE
jgi:hypothetical protein